MLSTAEKSAVQSEEVIRYPALHELGIRRFEEISHYDLQQQGNAHDVLRVYYQRAAGSLLPTRRQYRFGRSTATVSCGNFESSSVGNIRQVQEISPMLLQAIDELDALLGHRIGDNPRWLSRLLLKLLNRKK